MNHNAKAALIDSLNGLLADLFTLYLKTKNFHWHVRGAQFRDLHLLFDDQATQLFALTDLIAERVRKNGAPTLSGIGAIAAKSRIADQSATDLAAAAMKDAAGKAGDNATEGFADDWTDQAETRVWFLSQLLG